MRSNIFKNNLVGKDILLVVPPPFFPRMPPLGPAYLVNYLKYKGHKPELLDLNVYLHNRASEETRRFWEPTFTNSFFETDIAKIFYDKFRGELNDFVDWVLGSEIRIVGFSVNQVSFFLAERLAQAIKSKDKTRVIIFGGPVMFFNHPRDTLQPGVVDYTVVGEGEVLLASMVERIKKGEKIGREPGVVSGEDLGLYAPSPAPQVAHLDLLPFPTFEEFDLPAYNMGSDYKPLPLLLSRGCVKKCSYCVDHIIWPRYRTRSAQHTFQEIEYHCRVNKAKAFEFNDLLCNGNLRELGSLCDLIIEAGLKFDWVSYAIIRSDMTAELLSKMKGAGCHTIIYGMEHSSAKVLKNMNKGFSAQEAEKVIRLTHEAGICTNVNVIVGFPGETEEDLDEVVAFLRRNRNYIDEVTNISGCTLFPDSPMGQDPQRFGILLKEGEDPMLFRDTANLDRKARNERVARFSKIVEDIGLRKSIINRPQLNPLAQESILPDFLCDAFSPSTSLSAKTANRVWKRIPKLPFLLALFSYHFFLSVYLRIVKMLRKTVMFPGG